MTPKRTPKKAPAKAGAERIESPETAENIEAASKGERYALAMLYGRAAAWLREDKAPPEELREWLVDVLQDLHAVAWSAKDKDPDEGELFKQLKVATRFQRGRGRPASRQSAMIERSLANDVVHFLTWNGVQSLEEAFHEVSEYHKRKQLLAVEPDQVRDAWNRYRKEFGELHRVRRDG